MKISKNFHLEEFVSKSMYKKWGKNSIWWVDMRIVELAQFYRDYFGHSMFINTWKGGGALSYRGYREPTYKKGATMSQHRSGRAFDCHISTLTADEIRKAILDNENKFMAAGLTTIEDAKYSPTWVHSDIRHTGMSKIKIVKP